MPGTDPLRAEHAELRPHLDGLDHLAASLSPWTPDLRSRLTNSVEFLEQHLLPHAAAEEAVLYPAVDGALGAPGATATMIADHREITDRIRALEKSVRTLCLEEHEPAADRVEELRRQLYGLSAILHLHFAKEEEVLLGVLDTHLDDDEASDLFGAMAQVAHPNVKPVQDDHR